MATAKANILFVYGDDRTKLLHASANGSAPDEFLYGLPYLTHPRLNVEFIDISEPHNRLSERLWTRLHYWFAQRFFIGFYSNIYWRNRRRIQAADVVVTTKDSIGLPILWQKHAGRVPGKVVYISQGLYKLAERSIGNPLNERIRRAIGQWLERAESIVVFSHGDAQALKRSFDNCARIDPRVIFFGIDEKFWTPGNSALNSPGPDYILSVGSDSLRDYPLLLEVIGGDPLRIVARRALPPDALRPNVTVKSDLDWLELREWYRDCRFVVNPIKNEPRNSGHSATLQGMACGKAVILSDTPGLWDRQRMKHLETCYLVEPENPAKLRQAIDFLLTRPEEARRIGANARRLVEQEYSSQKYGQALQTHILGMLDGAHD